MEAHRAIHQITIAVLLETMTLARGDMRGDFMEEAR
jgi:hypothetical protein